MSDHHHIRGDSFCSDREGAIDVKNSRGQRMIRSQTGILLQRSGSALLRDRLLQLHALRILRIVVAQCGGSAEDQLIDLHAEVVRSQQRIDEPVACGKFADGFTANPRNLVL